MSTANQLLRELDESLSTGAIDVETLARLARVFTILGQQQQSAERTETGRFLAAMASAAELRDRSAENLDEIHQSCSQMIHFATGSGKTESVVAVLRYLAEVEQTSLGTEQARRLRRTTLPDTIADVVMRADERTVRHELKQCTTGGSEHGTAAPIVRAFAEQLRELRKQAGNPPYREMAKLGGCSASSLHRAVTEDRLPSWTVVHTFVVGCYAEPEPWRATWKRVRNLVKNPDANAAEATLNQAKEQTAAANASAETAHRSVDAAEAQTEETRKANELTSHAIDEERAARDARDEPQFAVKRATRNKKPVGRSVAVTLEEGPAVNVTLREVRPAASSTGLAVEIAADGAGPERLVKGAIATFAIQLGRVERMTQIELLLQCEEIEGPRHWSKWETVTFYPPARVHRL